MMMVNGRPVRYTWGLVYSDKAYTVAMYNLPKAEAERIEAASDGLLLARPISVHKYVPGSRKLEGSTIHGIG